MSEEAPLIITRRPSIFKNRSVDIVLSSLLVGLCFGYFHFGKWPHEFFGLFSIYSIQFAIYAFISYKIWQKSAVSFRLLAVTGILARIILIFSSPVLENDPWRYMWDGRVLANGINPYSYAPDDAALDSLDISYRHQIGWSHFGTIYPPLAQILFAVTHFIAPDSLIGIKILFLLFDVAIWLLLAKWLQETGRDQKLSFLYFLNPLVLKEIANSAHLDSIAVFFTLLATYLFSQKKKRLGAWISLALATASKLFPVLLVPVFLKLDSKWKKGLGLFIAMLATLYLPFIGAGPHLFGGTGAFAKYWIFNAGIFQVTTIGLNHFLGLFNVFSSNPTLVEAMKNDYPAKLFLGALFIFAYGKKIKHLKPETADLSEIALWVIGLLLLFSPVVDPWYVLWLLPFASLRLHIPWLSFSYLVIASYSWFYSKELAPMFRATEYLVFFMIFIWFTKKERVTPIGYSDAKPQEA